jgi:sec-independent protein translocase protein TatA
MNAMLALFNLGGGEIFLILAVILLLFGAKKIPEFARGMGQGIKEFKKVTREVTDEMHNAMDENPAPPPAKKIAPAESVPTDAQHPAAPSQKV